jgi:hypothetical protein
VNIVANICLGQCVLQITFEQGLLNV